MDNRKFPTMIQIIAIAYELDFLFNSHFKFKFAVSSRICYLFCSWGYNKTWWGEMQMRVIQMKRISQSEWGNNTGCRRGQRGIPGDIGGVWRKSGVSSLRGMKIVILLQPMRANRRNFSHLHKENLSLVFKKESVFRVSWYFFQSERFHWSVFNKN